MAKVFIVEDDENIRDLVVYTLRSTGFEAEGFDSGSTFYEALRQSPPNLILLDLMLPEEDGLQILKYIRSGKAMAKIPIILLSAKSSEYDKICGLDMGADDYITKPFSVLELISRIKAVLRRSAGEPPEILEYQSIKLYVNMRKVYVDDTLVTLTHKEFELLQLLLYNPENVMSRERIMSSIWGFDFGGESRTVDMHIKTLRQKLGVAGEFIKTIRGVGYKIGN